MTVSLCLKCQLQSSTNESSTIALRDKEEEVYQHMSEDIETVELKKVGHHWATSVLLYPERLTEILTTSGHCKVSINLR